MVVIWFLLVSFVAGIIVDLLWQRAEVVKRWASSYLLWFGIPFYFFITFRSTHELALGSVAFAAVLAFLLTSIISYLIITRLQVQDKPALYLVSTFGNTGLIGIPIATQFFGVIGTGVAAMTSLVGIVAHTSLGIFFASKLAGKTRFDAFLDVLKFPLFYTGILAFILGSYGITVPSALVAFGPSATYLSAFVIGLAIRARQFHWRHLVSKTAFTGYVLKFVVMPLLFLASSFLLPRSMLLPMVLLGAMPASLANTSMAVKLGLNDHFASEFTTITTAIVLIVASVASLF